MNFAPVARQAWRHTLRRPLQSLFLVLGVAIGVAMIVAIDLANGSASRAFTLGAESIAGRATHEVIGGPSGLDEALYRRLRVDLGYRLSAPVVEDYVTSADLDGQPMRLLGIDPFAEGPFRSYLGMGPASQSITASQSIAGPLTELLAQPDTVLISRDVAAQYGLTTGSTIVIQRGTETHRVTLAGLLEPTDDLSRRALAGLLIADIATAQELLGRVGRLDRIDLILPEGAAGESQREAIAAILPPSAQIQEAAARRGTVNEMTAAFRLNLTALSLLALVVGMFLIYNTVTFSVVQRRPVLGSLRALGMTRREIFAIVMLEAGVLGAIGALLGIGLGVLLGRVAVGLVTQTVNDLFFVVSVREVTIPVWTPVKGWLIGMAAALAGAAIPAWEATSVAPAGALRRSSVEDRTRALLPWVTGAGLVLFAAGALLLLPDASLLLSFAGLFVVVLGAALVTPVCLLGLMALAGWLFRRAGLITRMAPRTVIRSISRTAVAVAALMVAVSVIIGVGVMIGSFRQTVVQWLDDVLQADIFVSAPTLQSGTTSAALSPALVEQVRSFPGITHSATTRSIAGTAWVGEDGAPIDVRVQSVSDDLAGEDRRYRSSLGSNAETWRAVTQGEVLVNEPMAHRYDLGVGGRIYLQTDQGRRPFTIAGVTVDFDVNPIVLMDDAIYRGLWNDEGVSAVGLFVPAGTDVEAKVAELRRAFADKASLLIRSNRGTRENALAVFDRTFAITVALQLLATLVAFIGILSTLMSLQLERQREIGVLRATGMTRRQLWRLSLLETGLIGGSAGLLALPVGMALALILIYIINLRSFGWTLQLSMDPRVLAQALLVAIGAALLAGIYPAWRLGQTQPAVAVRSE